MNEHIDRLIAKHRGNGVLVDSNLLMLYFVGELMPDQIPRLRRTKQFVRNDYLLLKALIELFAMKWTTPNILTELSNLANDIPSTLRTEFMRAIRSAFENLEERYLPSITAASGPIFGRFGLTDSAIALLAAESFLVITADFPLANYLESIKADVINFHHLRTF